ncbi:MAG: hypothetical protein JWM74_2215 [Myxococcaceae bacterium]|nr:hypothetical protein [Myxococcaceae bacterium]
MRRAIATVPVLLAALSCGSRNPHPASYPEVRWDCLANPDGIAPARPDIGGYAAQELFEDERDLATSGVCAAPQEIAGRPRAIAGDPEVKAACQEVAAKGDPASVAACRRACLVSARIENAGLLYEAIVTGLRELAARYEARKGTACKQVLASMGNSAGDGGARLLWDCLGLPAVSPLMTMQVVFHPLVLIDDGTTLKVGRGELDMFEINGPLLPGATPYTFTLARGGSGCASKEWQTWMRIERRAM